MEEEVVVTTTRRKSDSADAALMTAEAREAGVARAGTWWVWAQSAGGWWFLLGQVLTLALDRACYVGRATRRGGCAIVGRRGRVGSVEA